MLIGITRIKGITRRRWLNKKTGNRIDTVIDEKGNEVVKFLWVKS